MSTKYDSLAYMINPIDVKDYIDNPAPDYTLTNLFPTQEPSIEQYNNIDASELINLREQGVPVSLANVNPNQVSELATLLSLKNQGEMLDLYKKDLQLKEQFQNSWQNKYLKPISMGIDSLTSLGNIFLGLKQYGLAKEQLGLAREKWQMTKDELNRIRNLRTKLTNAYMGK